MSNMKLNEAIKYLDYVLQSNDEKWCKDHQVYMKSYIKYCKENFLNDKTIKFYKIDLKQFFIFANENQYKDDIELLNKYIAYLKTSFKPSSARRKTASIKAYYSFLRVHKFIERNPFNDIETDIEEETVNHKKDKIIPQDAIKRLFNYLYSMLKSKEISNEKKRYIIRDIAVIELLYSTAMRTEEICFLKDKDINFDKGAVNIEGKGARNRLIYINNNNVLNFMQIYRKQFREKIEICGYFFVNCSGGRFSEQSLSRMIKRYAGAASISSDITPGMIRNTVIVQLLEEGTDIEYVKNMIGQTYITTAGYKDCPLDKDQQDTLQEKHPRNRIKGKDEKDVVR